MAYRKIYFRIHTECYSSGWSSDTDRAAFKEESRRLFQELGWTVKLGCNGGCDTVSKDRQDLYLHPSSFSGVMDEANTEALQEKLTQARTFYCYHIDRYEEYRDLSDEGYRAELETKRDEIIAYILKRCRTKRSNLYIVDPVAAHVAEHFKVHRLCDRHGNGKNRDVNAHFGKIHTLEPGDTVTLTTRLGTRTYAVSSVEKVSEVDTSGTAATSDNRLTLYTCVRDERDFRWKVTATEKAV